jgi:hypothetical protein
MIGYVLKWVPFQFIAALYNKNADSEKRITSLVSETINNYNRIEHDQNVTVINMGRRFDDFSIKLFSYFHLCCTSLVNLQI